MTYFVNASKSVTLQSNAYLLGVCNFWCDKAYPAYEILRGATMADSECNLCDNYQASPKLCSRGCRLHISTEPLHVCSVLYEAGAVPGG